jgi:hypothetical protein
MFSQKKIPFRFSFVSWFCACAVMIFTAFVQYHLYVPIQPAGIHEFHEPQRLPRVAGQLENYINRRKTEIQASSVGDENHLAESDDSAAYFSRPSIAVSAIVTDGRKKFVAVILEGQKETQIVRQGDEVAGIRIIEIEPEGIMCQWRRLKFFVPLM